MDLLERDDAVRELAAALDDARRGDGRVALVGGEAGIGKTTLVRQFAAAHRAAAPVLWGTCDALFTPRPLGPLHDMAARLPEALRGLLVAAADRTALFAAVLAELQRRPAIVVVEDIHWADEATLDLVRFLGRRVARTAALLVLTYRDDELEPRHPLRSLLGDLASSATVRRVALPPLSEAAVRQLVGPRPFDAAALHRRSGGNPFFVTECLAGGGVGIPATVRDATLARAARLSPLAHAVVQTAAIIGPRVEPWLLEAVAGGGAEAVEEGLALGMLAAQGELLAFRHELARQAVLEALPPPRRVAIHRLALAALAAAPGAARDPARLAHHAAGAGDRAATLAHAPVAALQAASVGAHRAAAALFALALAQADDLPPAERAALLEAHAAECLHIADLPGAIAGRAQAVAVWRAAGDPLKQGEGLDLLARALFMAGRREEARRTSRDAIALLEAQPPGRELALAYSTAALLRLLDYDLADAIALGERAVALAERTGDAQVLASAHNVLGSAAMLRDDEGGRRALERARAIAQGAGLDGAVAAAYANLGSAAIKTFRLDQAERDLAAGLAYCAARDLDRLRRHMVGWLSVAHLQRGRWPAAEAAAAEVLGATVAPGNARWAALLALGRLQARRDGVAAPPPLDEALALGLAWGEFQMIGPVRAARAEAAWLAGALARVRAEIEAAYDLAVAKRHPWVAGELALWRWRAGEPVSVPDWLAAPFARQIVGDWRGAADAWGQLGCPYERARALADGDDAARTAALGIFQALGARPAAAALRRAMRDAGATRIPRGPWRATREGRHGLTARQGEILDLLAEGLSNAAIAARLSIAPKTVDHHVSAILARLDVHSRQAAAAWARRPHSPGLK